MSSRPVHPPKPRLFAVASVATLLVVLLLVAACGSSLPDASGDWEGEVSVAGQAGDARMSLRQSEEGTLSGFGTLAERDPSGGEEVGFVLDSGTVQEDGSVGFLAHFEGASGEEGTQIEFSGEIDGDELEGDFTAPGEQGAIRASLERAD